MKNRGFLRPVERVIESAAAMEAFGAETAAGLGAGATLGLVGGLGAGKTHFVKGLAAGLGHGGEVTSPTFALVHEYDHGRIPVFHFDFYRLDSDIELLELGWDEFLDRGGVVVAEWADLFPDLMPADTRWLHFAVRSDGARQIVEA